MAIDHLDLLPVAKRLIRQRTADLTRGMPRNERAQFIEDEGESLAYALAEVAEDRIVDVRAEMAA